MEGECRLFAVLFGNLDLLIFAIGVEGRDYGSVAQYFDTSVHVQCRDIVPYRYCGQVPEFHTEPKRAIILLVQARLLMPMPSVQVQYCPYRASSQIPFSRIVSA